MKQLPYNRSHKKNIKNKTHTAVHQAPSMVARQHLVCLLHVQQGLGNMWNSHKINMVGRKGHCHNMRKKKPSKQKTGPNKTTLGYPPKRWASRTWNSPRSGTYMALPRVPIEARPAGVTRGCPSRRFSPYALLSYSPCFIATRTALAPRQSSSPTPGQRCNLFEEVR